MLIKVQGGTGAGTKRPKREPSRENWHCLCYDRETRHAWWIKRCTHCGAKKPRL